MEGVVGQKSREIRDEWGKRQLLRFCGSQIHWSPADGQRKVISSLDKNGNFNETTNCDTWSYFKSTLAEHQSNLMDL